MIYVLIHEFLINELKVLSGLLKCVPSHKHCFGPPQL